MARFNEILVGRYNRFLQKFLSMKGGPPAPQLASDIAATWALFHGAENRYLEAWDRFGESYFVAATVGFTSTFRIRNPAGSNVIAVIEKLSVQIGAIDTILILNYTTDPGNLATLGPGGGSNVLDTRGRTASTTVTSTTSASSIATGTQIGRVLTAANVTNEFIFDENQEIPLAPGGALDVRTTAANEAVGGTIFVRERFLEESERA